MKKIPLIAFLFGLIMCSFAMAANPDPQKHPCHKVKEACISAGFAENSLKKNQKGLYKDCLQPLLNGQAVPGVSVSAKEVQACREKLTMSKTAH